VEQHPVLGWTETECPGTLSKALRQLNRSATLRLTSTPAKQGLLARGCHVPHLEAEGFSSSPQSQVAGTLVKTAIFRSRQQLGISRPEPSPPLQRRQNGPNLSSFMQSAHLKIPHGKKRWPDGMERRSRITHRGCVLRILDCSGLSVIHFVFLKKSFSAETRPLSRKAHEVIYGGHRLPIPSEPDMVATPVTRDYRSC
jgi:hypothetical protein